MYFPPSLDLGVLFLHTPQHIPASMTRSKKGQFLFAYLFATKYTSPISTGNTYHFAEGFSDQKKVVLQSQPGGGASFGIV